jgi:integrase
MPSGAAVIRRAGSRRAVWSLKFIDAAGDQVWERLGPEPAWSRQKAERELGKRLQAVEHERWRKPARTTFGAFAERFERDYLPGRNLKPSTHADYLSILNGRLIPFFGDLELGAIEPSDVDAYVASVSRELAPKTVKNHLGLLQVMFKVAMRWRLVRGNPLHEVEAPRVETPEINVLTETEIGRLLAAYDELADAAATEQREWWLLAKHVVVVALATGLRRGELLGLRWRDCELLERRLHVRETIVRGRVVSPKSRTSRRTVELGPYAVGVLAEVFKYSRYRSEDSLVFCHPVLGTPLDPSKLSREYLRPALEAGGITKPFRPWHDLRHTALTHDAAVGNPQAYIQLRAGHSQGSITERYIHAAQVLFPGAAAKAEARIFGSRR